MFFFFFTLSFSVNCYGKIHYLLHTNIRDTLNNKFLALLITLLTSGIIISMEQGKNKSLTELNFAIDGFALWKDKKGELFVPIYGWKKNDVTKMAKQLSFMYLHYDQLKNIKEGESLKIESKGSIFQLIACQKENDKKRSTVFKQNPRTFEDAFQSIANNTFPFSEQDAQIVNNQVIKYLKDK